MPIRNQNFNNNNSGNESRWRPFNPSLSFDGVAIIGAILYSAYLVGQFNQWRHEVDESIASIIAHMDEQGGRITVLEGKDHTSFQERGKRVSNGSGQ